MKTKPVEKTKPSPSPSVDDYIADFPPPVRKALRALRKTIRQTAPQAEEIISYHMPAYKWHGMLIYFAGWQQHVAIYPRPRGNKTIERQIAKYEGGKGTIKFPLDQPLPLDLVAKIVKYQMRVNESRAAKKRKKGS